VQPYLNPQQFRLYELIYNRFVASQMAPAIFAITNVEITADKGLFKTQGRIEKFDGYRKVLPPRGKQEDVTLPKLNEKQLLDQLDLTASQHFTQPPPRFNEASLVKALEKEGIGRPSTYAAIIAKIQDHGHVKLEHRKFFATEIGKKATDLLSAGFPKVINVSFTSHIEEELDDIENGKIQNIAVLNEFWSPFETALKSAKANVSHETGEMCPKCGQPLINRLSKTTGKGFVGCSGWKKDGTGCDYIKPGEGEPERPAAVDVGIPCPTCGKPMLKKMSRFGTEFLSCSAYKTDGTGCNTSGNLVEGKLQVTVEPSQHPCPKCGKMLLLRQGKNGPFLACPDNKKCKTIVDADEKGNPKKEPDLGINCEKCGSPMRIRTSFRGPFLSCSGYPKCRNAKSINAELREKLKDHLPAAPPKKEQPTIEVSEKCPECSSAMKVRFGRGKPFLGCSKYPKCKGTLPASQGVLDQIEKSKQQ
jgi:DNA topoisomerase-1